MNANCSKIEKSLVYYISFHITYMSNLHCLITIMWEHSLIELRVIYDTPDVMTYFTFMILYGIYIYIS